jgi:hypothetical protein
VSSDIQDAVLGGSACHGAESDCQSRCVERTLSNFQQFEYYLSEFTLSLRTLIHLRASGPGFTGWQIHPWFSEGLFGKPPATRGVRVRDDLPTDPPGTSDLA